MFFIFLAELAGGILAYVYRAEARTFVVGGLGRTIRDLYGRNGTSTAEAVTTAVNQIQQRVRVSRAGSAPAATDPLIPSPPLQFECCGLGNSSNIDGFWEGVQGAGAVPSSCCSTFGDNPGLACVPQRQFNEVSACGGWQCRGSEWNGTTRDDMQSSP